MPKRKRECERNEAVTKQVIMDYAGWVPSMGDKDIERLAAFPSPIEFFERFVKRRKPVVIAAHPEEEGWRASASRWTSAYLSRSAGHLETRVEVRKAGSNRFGYGSAGYERMPFARFLSEHLDKGDESRYLTTEAATCDGHGRLAVVSPPLTAPALLADIPLRPKVVGTLVPAALNLWLGRSRVDVSSGLHHDYHDNLFVLFRGRKRFELQPPVDAVAMIPAGEVAQVHANGRITYLGAPPVRADGADARDLARVARLDLDAAEAAEDDTKVDMAMLAAMRAEAGDLRPTPDVSEAEEDESCDGMPSCSNGGDDADEPSDGDDDDAWAAGGDDYEEDNSKVKEAEPADEDVQPPHVSNVDVANAPLEFRNAKQQRGLSVEVKAGETLWLPAGWWHEVFSADDGGADGHFALNYWFHPPDAIESSTYEKPYRSQLWERDFEHWRRDILPTFK